jgi:demethylmenaquinone methyltransferase/2-methoxy-6-polyprenyl-1,4-benzoquinol methylase
MAKVQPGEVVADIACGTGDLTLAFARRSHAARVIGLDYTVPMLDLAAKKPKAHKQAPVTYLAGDATALPMADASVDVLSIAFGLRNVADPSKAIAEFSRVLRPGGRLVILEFSLPGNPLLRGLYNAYFNHILPRTASWIARDRSGAYRYLPRSVNTFVDRSNIVQMLEEAGLKGTRLSVLSFGIAVIYVAQK